MNSNRRIGSLTLFFLLFLLGSYSHSEENAKTPSLGFEWGAYFDAYYQVSPNGHTFTPAAAGGPNVLEGRIFDRQVGQLSLNMVEVSLKKKTATLSFRADVAFGEMVDQLSGGGFQTITTTTSNSASNEPTRNLTFATVTYTASEQFSFIVGKFYTHVGYEGARTKDNWQYSRSFTYNYAVPFWHEGIGMTYTILPNAWTASLYGLNGWDGRVYLKSNKSCSVGANLSYSGSDSFSAAYNYIGGSESTDSSRREVHDLNSVFNTKSFSIAEDLVYGVQKNMASLSDTSWLGFAVYVKMLLSERFSLSTRYEFFDDSASGFSIAGGLTTAGTKQKISSGTLTGQFNLGDGLEVRLEARSDRSDSDQYFKKGDGSKTDHQESALVGFLFTN